MPHTDTGWLPLADRIVREFESCARALPNGNFLAYPDPATGNDPWTIGWGSTGPEIRKGVIWTKAQCDARLLHDLLSVYGPAVDRLTAGNPTSDHQKAALTSAVYNLGETNIGRSALLRFHNDGNYLGAAEQFLRWNRAGGKVMRGLTRRREAERALYLGIKP